MTKKRAPKGPFKTESAWNGKDFVDWVKLGNIRITECKNESGAQTVAFILNRQLRRMGYRRAGYRAAKGRRR